MTTLQPAQRSPRLIAALVGTLILAAPALGQKNAPPQAIVFLNPSPDAFAVPAYTQVSATFNRDMNPATIHNGTFLVSLGTVPIPGLIRYIPKSRVAVFSPIALLPSNTICTATLTTQVRDLAGGAPLTQPFAWTFRTANGDALRTADGAAPPGPAMQAYFGDLHNHSSYSDGTGTPADAFATARANGLDFFALTDHSSSLDPAEWQDMLNQATAATIPGQFVGLRGFEFTHPNGHINVFETDTYVSEGDSRYNTLPNFYAWLASQSAAIGQFNHPYSKGSYNWNFNDFAYNAAGDSKIVLFQKISDFSKQYPLSLAAGWHAGLSAGMDTHGATWGQYRGMGLVAPALTKEAILDALRARRTFSTENQRFVLAMQANGYWMGSVIPNWTTLYFTITAYQSNPTGEVFKLVLYDNDVAIAVGGRQDFRAVKSAAPSSESAVYTWSPVVSGSPGHYYYVSAISDGNYGRAIAYTSPVWTTK
ncbi:MAG: CehA/McbA family metallohydrolase [Bryobacterales bacterium]|nr:CehA/McbA family metallohydrolase [Bryobacterales bacterium]